MTSEEPKKLKAFQTQLELAALGKNKKNCRFVRMLALGWSLTSVGMPGSATDSIFGAQKRSGKMTLKRKVRFDEV